MFRLPNILLCILGCLNPVDAELCGCTGKCRKKRNISLLAPKVYYMLDRASGLSDEDGATSTPGDGEDEDSVVGTVLAAVLPMVVAPVFDLLGRVINPPQQQQQQPPAPQQDYGQQNYRALSAQGGQYPSTTESAWP